MRRKIQRVKGHSIPKPQMTGWGYWAIFAYAIVPFLGALALLDGAIYLLARELWGVCYGVWCWF